jgi:hypothetical protein
MIRINNKTKQVFILIGALLSLPFSLALLIIIIGVAAFILAFILIELIGFFSLWLSHMNIYLNRLLVDGQVLLPLLSQLPKKDWGNLFGSFFVMGSAVIGLLLRTRKNVMPSKTILRTKIKELVNRGSLFIFVLVSIGSIIYTVTTYAGIYEFYGIIDTADNKTPTHNSVDCLYFSIVTWTTLGYGDFRPTPVLRLFAASEAVAGYVDMGIFIVGLVSYFYKSRSR